MIFAKRILETFGLFYELASIISILFKIFEMWCVAGMSDILDIMDIMDVGGSHKLLDISYKFYKYIFCNLSEKRG